jgi:CheY-like chemotaxis protein
MAGEKILVIDDSDVVLTRLRTALVEAGYEVVTTSQTVGAARHLRSCQLVIVDYHMPGLNGGNVLASLKAAVVDQKDLPLFYLYTTDTRVADTHHDLGFDGCFAKKGDYAALVPQVQAVFRMQRMLNKRPKVPGSNA